MTVSDGGPPPAPPPAEEEPASGSSDSPVETDLHPDTETHQESAVDQASESVAETAEPETAEPETAEPETAVAAVPSEGAEPQSSPEEKTGPKHRRARGPISRRRKFGWIAAALAVCLIAALAVVVARRESAAPPLATVTTSLDRSVTVTGSIKPMPWPSTGEAAFSIPELGVVGQSTPETAVPVASLTKLVNAYVVLKDHPLSEGDDGPSITVTAADVADYDNDQSTDQANVQVVAGEVLTERQVLEGMLVHSANNLADLLAEWDAGSIPAFVAKMNTSAEQLGMTSSHFADASGDNEMSVSTPADLLKVASVDMDDPTFKQIVSMPSVTLPVAGTVSSYTPLLGEFGIVGVKSGFDLAAGGCDVMALVREIDGQSMMVLAAVSGQRTGLDLITTAGLAALLIANSAMSDIVAVHGVSAGRTVAVARSEGHSVRCVTTRPVTLLAWPGQVVLQRVRIRRVPRSGARAGWLLGSAVFSVGGERQSVPVRTSATLPLPSFFQRLF